VAEDFSKGETIIVIGGTVGTDGVIDTSANMCTVEQVGEWDLLIRTKNSSSPPWIVSKKVCLPLRIDSTVLAAGLPRSPTVGDMIFYQGKINWKDPEPTSLAGTVYEIKYSNGRPTYAKVHAGDQMLDLPYDDMMVLQRKSSS